MQKLEEGIRFGRPKIPLPENFNEIYAKSKPLGIGREEVPAPPTPRHLPQTGHLWWPVMAFGGLGVLMLCYGMIRKNRNK